MRKAVCKGKSEVLSLPIKKLFPLEIQSESTVADRTNVEEGTSEMMKKNENMRQPRSRRVAALDTCYKSHHMLDA